ncbi:MAG: metalloregulator ArsR/SmtB family transcription factor [Rubrivivax sp.]|nr:metalloregulator ArsR/SmtB family transcription factor [Rubrivivax sp.]
MTLVAHCADDADTLSAPARALQAAAGRATGLLRSLANPERLILMCALADGERCVGELAALTGIHQPTLSQQLGVLRDEGLVLTRREGKFIHYRVASTQALELLALLHRLYCGPADAC